jgi:predicted permease
LSVALLVVLVLSIITGLAAGLLAAFWHADSADAQMVMQLATALANIVVLPMVPASQVALYQDLKLRREIAGGATAT